MSFVTLVQAHFEPCLNIKCHRSRSNKSLSYNDRYLATEFDVIVATPTNALFEGGTLGEEFEIVSEPGLLEILYGHYGVSDILSLIESTNKDWRFVLPTAIAELVDGYKVIPRTPSVKLFNDPNWLPLNLIQPSLEAIVKSKARQ